jgi:uncharacterized membrane protein (TIGR02234 family)
VAVDPTGRTLAPSVAGLALVALAGGIALAATRGFSRLVTAAILTVAGVGIVVSTMAVRSSLAESVAPEIARAVGRTGLTPSELSGTLWPWVAIVGGLLVAAAGIAGLVRGRRWPGMSQRYDAPASARDRSQTSASGSESMWQAQDRGEDPTA